MKEITLVNLINGARHDIDEVEEQIHLSATGYENATSTNEKVRILRMLAELDPPLPYHEQRIMELMQMGLTDASGPVRLQAVESIFAFSSKTPSLSQAILHSLAGVFAEDHNQAVAERAGHHISMIVSGFDPVRMDRFIADQLEILELSPIESEAAQAAILLGISKSHSAIRPLWGNRDHPSTEVQVKIAWALGQLGLFVQDNRLSRYLRILIDDIERDSKVSITAQFQLKTYNEIREKALNLPNHTVLLLPVNGWPRGNQFVPPRMVDLPLKK